MPQTKEEKNAKERERYYKNKDERLVKCKQYYDKNKEKVKAYSKKYYAENTDKARIKQWKKQGIIDGDFPLLEKVFEEQTHCWICWESYNVTKRKKCLDHDWDIKDDDNVRYICCHTCNVNVVG